MFVGATNRPKEGCPKIALGIYTIGINSLLYEVISYQVSGFLSLALQTDPRKGVPKKHWGSILSVSLHRFIKLFLAKVSGTPSAIQISPRKGVQK